MFRRPLFLALTAASLIFAKGLPAFAEQSDQRIVCAVGSNFGDDSSVAIVAGAVPTGANEALINKQCRLMTSKGNWNAIDAHVNWSSILDTQMCIVNFGPDASWNVYADYDYASQVDGREDL